MMAVKTVASASNSKIEAEAAHLKAMSTFCSEELAVGGIGCWKNWLLEEMAVCRMRSCILETCV